MTLRLIITTVCSVIIFAANSQIFNDAVIHSIRIETSDDFLWDSLAIDYQNLQDTGTKKYRNVLVIIDGDSIPNCGIRWRGEYSNKGFAGIKKPLKIDFAEFNDTMRFQGLKKINLANFALDPSFMRDKISYEFHQKQGNIAPRTSYSNVFLNDVKIGFYLIVEQIDKNFLDRHFVSKKGNLYKCIGSTELKFIDHNFDSYEDDFALRTNKNSENHNFFTSFLSDISTADYFNASAILNDHFNTDAYLKILSVDVFLNNWDSYYGNGRNFYLYENPKDHRLNWIPWDYNLSFSPYRSYIFPYDKSEDNFKPLIKKIEGNACLRNQYLQVCCELLEKLNRPYWYNRIEELKNLIASQVSNDPNKFYSTELFYDNVYNNVVVEKPNLQGDFLKNENLPGIKEIFDKRPNEIKRDLEKENFDCNSDICESCIDVRVYPNPNSGNFKIEITSKSGYLTNFNIYSITGQRVLEYQFSKELMALEKSFELPKGIYFATVKTKDFKVKQQKIIVQ